MRPEKRKKSQRAYRVQLDGERLQVRNRLHAHVIGARLHRREGRGRDEARGSGVEREHLCDDLGDASNLSSVLVVKSVTDES